MFTAENWRNFPRLRLVLPIRPMTSFFTNFYLFRNAQYCTTFGRFHWFLVSLFEYFFVLRVAYLLSDFSMDCSQLLYCLPGGSFEIGLVSCCGTLQGPVTCLGHVDVSWFMVIRDLL